MNKRILISLSIISLVSAIVIGGTIAYFSDVAKTEGNYFSTGNADLKIKSPDLENCQDWQDSCPGKTWQNLYPGWSDSYRIWLKNVSRSPIVLKIVPFIEETGSSEDLWNNTFMEITWADGSHSTGKYSLSAWKSNQTIELEPRLNQGEEAGPWVVKFEIPETVGNEIANSEIRFNLVFNGIQANVPQSQGCIDYYYDGDGDNWGVTENYRCLLAPQGNYRATQPGDCDDNNSSIHPQAYEVCNQIDDNCDAIVDNEGATGCLMYYFDSDNDSYGMTNNKKCLCAPQGSYKATQAGDCNDYDASVYPGAQEKCNGKDDNCDGRVDEENSQGCVIHYYDYDNDSFGKTIQYLCTCGPYGYYRSTKAGDCDDNDASTYPGAPEICTDQKDNDCDGIVNDGCS